MKTTLIAALFLFVASNSAFAQTAPSSMNPGTSGDSASNPIQMGPTNQGTWTPPYGEAIAPKTRAEVYQELVEAEQDGQLAYLNSTLYAHH